MAFSFLPSFSAGSKKSSATTDYSTTGQQSVISPEWWKTGVEGQANQWANFSAPFLQPGGAMTPGQQQGYDTLAWLNTADNPALRGGQAGLDKALTGYNEGRGGMEFTNTQLLDPLYRQDARTMGGVGDVSAQTGFQNATPYRDAYGTGVLDAAMGDFDVGTERAANAFRAGSIGGGAQASGSRPVAAGVLAADAARNRGSLGAQIRSDILDKSFGFGGQDASRNLSADMANQQKNLSVAGSNLAASQNQDRLRFDTANQIGQNALTYAGLGVDAANAMRQAGLDASDVQTQSALNQIMAAGIPIEQAIAIFQAGQWPYNTATAGFGQTNTESGTEKQTGKSSGFSFGGSAT